MAETRHGSFPLYESAGYCGHAQPPEPGTADDTGWPAWDEYRDEHPFSDGFSPEPICLPTPVGTFCPACTEVEREERDLPVDEYVECRLGEASPAPPATPASANGQGTQRKEPV